MTILSSGNVGIGTTNPQYTLDVNGAARVNGTIYNDPQYISGPTTINSYINYRYAVSIPMGSYGGQTITFVTFNTFSSTPCTYLISASNATAGAGNATAIITLYAGSPPTVTITNLQATGMSYTANGSGVLGFGYSSTSTTLSISSYNSGWWGTTQTYYFTMQLLSGHS